MTEHPIIFSGEEVCAIRAGRKTQTRRVVGGKRTQYHSITERDDGMLWPWRETADAQDYWYPCPYGSPGDTLWVRETCRAEAIGDEGLCGVRYVADGQFMPIANTREASDRWVQLYSYRGMEGATAPPIHMPRWASRITLEVTDVRVERLQDISEADAVAEGCRPIRPELVQDGLIVRPGRSAVEEFRQVWEEIHGEGSWEKNPWVWVIEFKKLRSAIKELCGIRHDD